MKIKKFEMMWNENEQKVKTVIMKNDNILYATDYKINDYGILSLYGYEWKIGLFMLSDVKEIKGELKNDNI